MSTRHVLITALSVVCMIVVCCPAPAAGDLTAYSLREAESRMEAPRGVTSELVELGGITRIAGAVHDQRTDDVILVGQACDGERAITLDDLSVAMRALMSHGEWPVVSIDKTPETAETGRQHVRFEGGIENTSYGRDFLSADITLKRMGLGLIPAGVWGVESYVAGSADLVRETGVEERVNSRFWFDLVGKCYNVALDGVFAIKDREIGVYPQLLSVNGERVEDRLAVEDGPAEAFADAVTANFDDLASYYPEIARLRVLFDLAAVAHYVDELPDRPDMGFWLSGYPVSRVETPEEYDLLVHEETIATHGTRMRMVVEGGVSMRALSLRLQDGDATALRDAVLKSRPDPGSLTWTVPIEGWTLPGYPEPVDTESAHDPRRSSGAPGCNLGRTVTPVGAPCASAGEPWAPPPASAIPDFGISDRLSPQWHSPDVGGVMLSGAAEVAGCDGGVSLGGGGFSLVVDGEEARLDPESFRKFVTALWSVYYAEQDPGISIDPIEPGGEKHLVRYIGDVLNTDLARVMRETDYIMKQWAVGTGRPGIPGFRNPDEIAARRGVMYVGAMSRFWLVPEDMRFRAADDLLLFDDGRMTVQTEYMFRSDDMQADPANEEFAREFTRRYDEIAREQPVYAELFEYSKLVSLAKFLKEKGVPLYWFLLANKDLVLTEESVGTVDALRRDSDYFDGVYIEGGVDLVSEGQYVYDADATRAIEEALAKLPDDFQAGSRLTSDRAIASADPFSFGLEEDRYTVVPQHSLTSGVDRRGIRYQTDLALRDEGFLLTEDALDEVRAEMLYDALARELRGYDCPRDEIPYDELWDEALASVESDDLLKKLRNLVNLEYRTESEFVAALRGAIGRDAASSHEALIKAHAHYEANLELVRYYDPRRRGAGDFGDGWRVLIPYRMEELWGDGIEFAGFALPESVAVVNLITGDREVLGFSPGPDSSASYSPPASETSDVWLVEATVAGTYRMYDRMGNEFRFDSVGRLTDMMFSESCRPHFEYDTVTVSHDRSGSDPFSIEPAGEEREEFLNVLLPSRMSLVDHEGGPRETFRFDADRRGRAAYVPEDEAGSEYAGISLYTDGSFVLELKDGSSEIAFDPAGRFDEMTVSVLGSVSLGVYEAVFDYDLVGDAPRICEARVMREGGAEPVYVATYRYGVDNGLCQVNVQLAPRS